MLVPHINPDEFGPGYMIRLGLINGHKSYKSTTNALLGEYPELSKTKELVALQLSTVLEMGIEQYCQQHTLLPVFRSITSIEEQTPNGSMSYPYAIQRFAHFGLCSKLKFCKTCTSEDTNYLGYSYYRLSHQLPGAYYCNKHQSAGPLNSVELNIFLNPDAAEKSSVEEPFFQENEIINRFLKILDGVFDFKQPINPNRFISNLQSAAKGKELRWAQSGSNKLYSDYLFEKLPKRWLSELMPTIGNKSLNKRFCSIDGVLSPQVNPLKSLNYILALAALFEDSDTALLMIKNAYSISPKEIRSLRVRNKIWEGIEINKLYAENDGSGAKISRKLGINPEIVRTKLDESGLPQLGQFTSNTIKAFKLFMEGIPFNEVILQTGITNEQFEQLLRKMCSKFSTSLNLEHNQETIN